MKLAIVGAGATGGYLGGKLAASGADVTLIARGAHLAAMRERGVTIREGGEEIVAHPACTDELESLGGADVVFLTLKAHSLPALAPRLSAALRPGAALVTAQNGVPWWYFSRHGGPLEGTRLRSMDPEGILHDSFAPEQVIGCVVWPATRLVEPGIIQHVEGNRFSIGELDGERSERCQAISAALVKAGLKCPVSRRIRHDMWLKLLGNVAFNPIGALTRATLEEIARTPVTRAVTRAVMEEANEVARRLGIELEITVEQRLNGAEKVGAHKPSMLQDIEAGRPTEVEALVGAVVELGDLLSLPMPHLRTVYALASLLDRTTSR
jgi:2-dehydropantoate 2-reductase